MSDYDILIVTRRRLGLKEYDVYARITERFSKTNKANFTPGRNSSTKVFPG